MHVGEHRQTRRLGDRPQDACAFTQAGPAKAVDRCAVGLVVAGLEDVRDGEVGGDALDGLGDRSGVLLAFDHAGAGDEEELSGPDGYRADFKIVGHEVY